MSKPENRVRVQIDLAPQSFERLKRLKASTEASSYTDVLKDALRLYEFLVELDERGETITATDKDGREVTLKLFV